MCEIVQRGYNRLDITQFLITLNSITHNTYEQKTELFSSQLS